jgi:PAS domain S-box-containing protein
VTTTTDTPQVLIVDDQPRNLDALEVMLAPLDCALVRAVTPDEALLGILRTEFAAIVLDIRMPGMSGIELARLIKQRRRSQHVPVLFLTAHLSDERDVLQGYGAGAVDYLSKPVNPDILRSKVGVFIDLFTKTRELARVNVALHAEIVQREQAQAALKAANEELERRVQERTAALSRAHQGVRENEERLRMALQVAGVAAWEWQLLSGQMTWSTDPETLFGFPAGAFGRELRMTSAVHPDDRMILQEALVTALQTGTYEANYRLVRPDGRHVWMTERGQVVGSPSDGGERMVGISRDVTAERLAGQERERLLAAAREARDEAERQSRLKDEFLATLSHELRTPMNAILGWLWILDSGKPVADVASALGVVRRNAELQARLIDDLLDMNRLISGNLRLELEVLDVGGLLQGAIQTLRPAAEEKGVHLIVSADSTIGTMVADARRLEQVLWNLVHNAVKFTEPGGRVEIRARRDGDCLEMAVQDTGRGMAVDFLPHAFERFRQEETSMSGRVPGLGLGLSIVKQLVELHGGSIEASSAGIGTGATFLVRLPVTRVAAATTGGSLTTSAQS